MTDLVKIYCDGAAMAYRDVANKLEEMIKNQPPELNGVLICLRPFVDTLRNKADEVYAEAKRFDDVMTGKAKMQ